VSVIGRLPDTDLIIVLGGDGATQNTARTAVPFVVPIFGINMGHIGFLSESEPDEWEAKLTRVLNGEYWLEKRLMLRAIVKRNGRLHKKFVGLNEIVVSRGVPISLINIHLHVDGEPIINYRADGLVVATPTGSTAYSMTLGGPVLPPMSDNFIVIPIAPHLSLDRPLLLSGSAKINLYVEMEADREAVITADGHNYTMLQNGDKIVVRKHSKQAAFVRLDPPEYFYRRLLRRLRQRSGGATK
jgi:NAD+ kinase